MKPMQAVNEGGAGRRLAPWPFLAGVVGAFLACCALGRLASDRNCFPGFVRFHTFLSPATLFYPTASEVRALGRDRLESDRIAVVVGGNSILLGHRVGPRELWTARLQEELGDRFRVINLAIPPARAAEFGGLAVEILQRDHPRLLYIADYGSAGIDTVPDGTLYSYFFWDAYYKGMVSPYPRREAALARAAAGKHGADKAAYAELRAGARLDAPLRFADLWNMVGCRYVSTVWTPLQGLPFPAPRARYVEGFIIPPTLEERYPASADEACMAIVRHMGVPTTAFWTQGSDTACPLAQVVCDCFPDACRRRTLMLVVRDSPRYVNRLDSQERAAYDATFAAFVRVLEANGMTALDVGRDYTELDYYDRAHIGEQGGRKLAADVAPKVRELAARLGYLP